MKYRKKPIVIEAFRFGLDDSPDWFKGEGVEVVESREDFYCLIRTIEGVMRGEIGDYIIKGIQGELYPCKKDIFNMTYEAIDES